MPFSNVARVISEMLDMTGEKTAARLQNARNLENQNIQTQTAALLGTKARRGAYTDESGVLHPAESDADYTSRMDELFNQIDQLHRKAGTLPRKVLGYAQEVHNNPNIQLIGKVLGGGPPSQTTTPQVQEETNAGPTTVDSTATQTPAPTPVLAPPPRNLSTRGGLMAAGTPSPEALLAQEVSHAQALANVKQTGLMELEKSKEEAAAERERIKNEAKFKKINNDLLKEGYQINPETGERELIPEDQLPPSIRANIILKRSQAAYADAGIALRRAETEFKRAQSDPNSPAFKLAQERLAVAQRNANTAEGNLLAREENNAALNYGVSTEGVPLPGALTLPNGTPVGSRNAANVRPTNQTRQMAETMLMLAPKMDSVISKLDDSKYADQLGPFMGRWNEFMAGTVGSGNPDFIVIRNAMNLMQTAEMRAHVGLRGNTALLDKFDSLNNANRMDAPTLKASLLAVKDFLSGYSNYVYGEQGPMRGMRQGPPSTRKNTVPTPAQTPGAATHRYNPDTKKVEAINP